MVQHADIDHTGLTGVGAGANPQVTTIELGHASDTTLARVSAGVVSIEGTNIVKAGAITSSGLTQATARLLGRSTASTGAVEEITLGTNLSFSGTTLNAAGGSASFKGAKAYTTGQTASNAVIVFGSGEVYDTDTIHDLASNQSRMTIPTTGYWEVKASGFVSRTDARLSIYVNGAIVRGGNTSGASAGNYASTSGVFNLSATDYVEIFANTTTTTTFGDNGNIGDNFVFSVTFLGA